MTTNLASTVQSNPGKHIDSVAMMITGPFVVYPAQRRTLLRDEVLNWLRSRPGVVGIEEEDGTTGPVMIMIVEGGKEVRFVLQPYIHTLSTKTCFAFETLVVDQDVPGVPRFCPGVGWEDRADYILLASASKRQVYFMRLDDLRNAASQHFKQKRHAAEIRGWIAGGRSALHLLVPTAQVPHDVFSLDDHDAVLFP